MSRTLDDGVANGTMSIVGISADGSTVAYTTTANDLVALDWAQDFDGFLATANSTARVTRSTMTDAIGSLVAVSADGRTALVNDAGLGWV